MATTTRTPGAYALRSYIKRDGAARFECECGENLTCEVGEIGERVRPVCECGRAWIILYRSSDEAEMFED